MPAGQERFVQNLEDRRRRIELVSVRQDPGDDAPLIATVFVPYKASAFLQRKLQEYRTQVTAGGRPRNENLINRIDSVAIAATLSFITDDLEQMPGQDQSVWWEVWIRGGLLEHFKAAAANVGVELRTDEVLNFAEREVLLAYADMARLGRLLTNSDAVAEIRLARDTPATFLAMNNVEQREWADALLANLQGPPEDAVSVCVLDSGVTHTHALLQPGYAAQDLHTYRPAWGTGDSAIQQGHGTAMSGIAFLGDLRNALLSTTPITVRHRMESVKMLDPAGTQHAPHLYGAVTAECVSRPEIVVPQRPRVFCMAVTSDVGVERGRPSSWSAEIDKLAYGTDTIRRLFLISTGNVSPGDIPPTNYIARNDIDPIFNPGQSWNALTVGAQTQKVTISDPSFNGWTPLASPGELSPTSRTSVAWERQWPVKPDVVCEGGNWATDGVTVDCPDDLAVLTTHFQPQLQQFTTIRDTSAATAFAANIAGRVLSARSELWPETLRALIVHSAEWTPAMLAEFSTARSRQQKLALLRRYGFGVPNVERALYSATNDATLVVEDTVRPFWRTPDGTIKTRDMHLHTLPWPRVALEELGETEVTVRVTLSYFVEPNPGERGWTRRHRYASHGLRFDVKRGLENIDEFRARINRAVQEEEAGVPADTGPDQWFFGVIRNAGSIHSDYWTGTAAELARRDAMAVYPVGGWWKEKPNLERYDRSVRYALIVSINASAGDVDIYTPILNAVTVPTVIEL